MIFKFFFIIFFSNSFKISFYVNEDNLVIVLVYTNLCKRKACLINTQYNAQLSHVIDV